MNASQKTLRQLKTVGSGISEADAKKAGINVGRLVSLGLVVKRTKSVTKYAKVENASRWAAKYKFTRKKYGIQEQSSSEVYYKLTQRGRNRIKLIGRDKSESDELSPEDIVVEATDMDDED
jgi:hypothetical protein